MKLAAIYTVFNGTELLHKSVKCLEESVDIFIFVNQKVSHYGEPQTQTDVENLNAVLSQMTKPFEVVHFTPILDRAKISETAKHNLGLEHARKWGATHFMLVSCDHLYFPEDVKFVRENFHKYKADVTLTRCKPYYKHPNLQCTFFEVALMPFICRLAPETRFEYGFYNRTTLLTDPACRIEPFENIAIIAPEDCTMHHYSTVRNDFEAKLRNAAARKLWTPERVQEFIDEFNKCTDDKAISPKYYNETQLFEPVEKSASPYYLF
jgi:hypothetical protein